MKKRVVVCESSPTGAHHYRLGMPWQGVTKGNCKYCNKRTVIEPKETGGIWFSKYKIMKDKSLARKG